MSERVLLDTCVLYPTLLRQLLLTCAEAGCYEPLWSARIMDEWHHAAARSGPVESMWVDAERRRLTARFPEAEVAPAPDLENTLSLPDDNDRHVLAAAIEGGANALLTLNLKDFPTRTLGRHGVLRYEPDLFLCGLLQEHPGAENRLRAPILKAEAELNVPFTKLLKKSRLTRLAKRLAA